MSVKLDGREVKVGDKLWDFEKDWVIVTFIANPKNNLYPIHVKVADTINTYTESGKPFSTSNRTLFWDEIKFDIPPPPKKKVKKWQWVYLGKDGKYFLTDYHYATREEAEATLVVSTLEGKLECSMIEVDEE